MKTGRIQKVSKHALVCIAAAVLTAPSYAQAIELGVYAHGGYDMVSSSPAEGAGADVASPEPTGPSYGLGVTSEFLRFADMFGLGANIGFGGASASWTAPKAGLKPSAVNISAMGIEGGARFTAHFGDFRVFGFGEGLYGLFGNEYTNTLDGTTAEPAGKVSNFKVNSALKVTGGGGAGYSMGPFGIDLRAGLSSLSLNVTTPADASVPNKEVTDTYVGFTVGLVASYRFMGGATSPSSSPKEIAPAPRGSKSKVRPDEGTKVRPDEGTKVRPDQKSKKKKPKKKRRKPAP